jgi:hypothetical protein
VPALLPVGRRNRNSHQKEWSGALNGREDGKGRRLSGRIAALMMALVLGPAVLWLVTFGTQGIVFGLVFYAVCFTPYVALHYFLWGRFVKNHRSVDGDIGPTAHTKTGHD